MEPQPGLFPLESGEPAEPVFSSLYNPDIMTVGPEPVFGRIYDHIGFGCIKEYLFRHLVISRLAFPLSKLKTTEYLYRYQGETINVESIRPAYHRLRHRIEAHICIRTAYTGNRNGYSEKTNLHYH
jgi:hypothetical protein